MEQSKQVYEYPFEKEGASTYFLPTKDEAVDPGKWSYDFDNELFNLMRKYKCYEIGIRKIRDELINNGQDIKAIFCP